jgi:hypothetical protein
VVTHQWPGLQRAIIGVRKRLDEKKPSLPKFSPGFNGPRGMPRQYWPFATKSVSRDLRQKKMNQSLNGLKKST